MNLKDLLQLYQTESCDLCLLTYDLHTEETLPAIYDIRNTPTGPSIMICVNGHNKDVAPAMSCISGSIPYMDNW